MMLNQEQIEQRLNYVTGTDSAIICGLSKYCTPYQLWLYKTRREVAPDISDKPSVKAGNMLEGAVRDWLALEIGKTIHLEHSMKVHDELMFMAGNIDGYICSQCDGEYAIVEIKTASSDASWGEPGTNAIPREYLLQVTHYMAVYDAPRCYVGVLIRGVDFRWYCIERDRDLEDWLIKKEKEFWDCVQADVEPEPSNTQDVVRMFEGKCTDQSRVADLTTEAHVLHYKEIREKIKQLEEAGERIKLEICKHMGEYSTLTDRGGRILATWNKPKDTKRFDAKKLQDQMPEVYAKYMYNSESSRRFVVK